MEHEVPVPKLDTDTVTELPGLDSAAAPAEETTPADQPVKRRRRRRKQQPEQSAQPEAEPLSQEETQFAQALAMGFDFGGRIAAGIRGDHWLFTPEETSTLGAVWAKALHPYMGRLAPYTPFILATVVTAGVMYPKVQRDRLIRAETIPIRRAPMPAVAAAVDGPNPLRDEFTMATTRDDGAYMREHTESPELQPPEPQPDTIAGAAAKRNRKRQNPPGVI